MGIREAYLFLDFINTVYTFLGVFNNLFDDFAAVKYMRYYYAKRLHQKKRI